jgi:hypothetical protein
MLLFRTVIFPYLRNIFLLLLLVGFCSLTKAVDAEVYLLDVPEGHWANAAVYDLVHRGITSGFPDGTYRGRKNMSRYEMAGFLSKLGRSFGKVRAREEKLVRELASEVAVISAAENKVKMENQVTGEVDCRARYASGASQGGRADYRILASWRRDFEHESSIKVNLDTMDAGYNTGSSRNLVNQLLDFVGEAPLGAANLLCMLGPGRIEHTESDNLFPSENHTYFDRPKSTLQISSGLGKINFAAAYVTRQVAGSGKVGLHELTGELGIVLGKVKVAVVPHYLFSSNRQDALADARLSIQHADNWQTNLLLSYRTQMWDKSGLYASFKERISNLWDKGIGVVLRADKVGSNYRLRNFDDNEFIDLNNFNRLVLDGTVDVGLNIEQALGKSVCLTLVGDYVTDGSFHYGKEYPGTYLLWEASVGVKATDGVTVQASYRTYQVPSGIAQFAETVPLLSNVIGVGMMCNF